MLFLEENYIYYNKFPIKINYSRDENDGDLCTDIYSCIHFSELVTHINLKNLVNYIILVLNLALGA